MKKTETAKLYIKQCSDPLMWYRNSVGEVVPLVREDTQFYWSREAEGYLNIVLKKDASVIMSTLV